MTYWGKTTKITTSLCQVTDLGVWKLAVNNLTEDTLYWGETQIHTQQG